MDKLTIAIGFYLLGVLTGMVLLACIQHWVHRNDFMANHKPDNQGLDACNSENN